MRSPTRFIRKFGPTKILHRLKHSGTRRLLEREISSDLNRPVRLVNKFNKNRRSHEIYYWAKSGGTTIGIVSLNTINATTADRSQIKEVDRSKKPISKRASRSTHEWHIYSRLYPVGLSPEPIWSGHNATLNSFIDWPSVTDQLISNRQRFWQLTERIFAATRAMHDLGVYHMDLNPGNILADENGDGIVFIDFELIAPADMSPAEKKAHDFIYFIGCTTRRRRGGDLLEADPSRMVGLLDAVVDQETRTAQFSYSGPSLQKISGIPGLRDSLRTIFKNI